MADDRDALSRDEFAHAVRDNENALLSADDHHPHGGYTPAAFRHYIRQIALLDALDGLTFDSALDVGCSEGYFLNVVRDRFGGQTWGVDLSTVALKKAHDRYGLPVAAADATRLPFADGSFDLVYSTEVIEHVLDPDLMVAEMRRVSRGSVLVTTPVSDSEDAHEPDFDLKDEGHVNNFDAGTVRRLFGPEAKLGSFRCNATLALIVGAGRRLPARPRDACYKLDHFVSQHWGAPDRSFKPLRNRDWLITVPGHGEGGAGDAPSWRCPACHGELEGGQASLTCSDCGAEYGVQDGVPDFFESNQPS
jgi:SAM-dependent methyltransferase